MDQKTKNRKVNLRVFAWAGVIIWTLVIFGFSGQDGQESGQLSCEIARAVYRLLMGSVPNQNSPDFQLLHMLIRKGAHMTEYAVLALLWQTALRAQNAPLKAGSFAAWGACFVSASVDEWRQTFVSGRSGRFVDVLIDGAGALMGVLLFCLIILLIQRRTSAPKKRA